MLHGRVEEQAEIDRLLTAARDGKSGALVLRGEAGIGKTALLDHAAGRATGMLVLRTLAVESEAELPYATLQLLMRPAMDHVDRLPAVQAEALRSAFGLGSAVVQDRFLVGLATLTLLSELGEDSPVLCVIDDAQWLDGASADALMFAARRLGAEGVAMLFAARDNQAGASLSAPGIPELRLAGLDREPAETLLAEHGGDLGPQVRQRIFEEAAGNPLALLELPAALTGEQRSGRVGQLPSAIDAGPPSSRVQQNFQEQISGYPEATQAVLLVAAADDTGDLGLVVRAAERLGSTLEDLEPAESAGLVHLSGSGMTPGFAFRHPLIRTAAYQAAPQFLRMAAHLALAEILQGDAQADRRAWHLAAAATGPDDEVADELDRMAVRAQERQGPTTGSAAFERAAELTTDERRSAERLTSAASLAVQAGQLERAVTLAERCVPLAADPRTRADLAHVLASVEFERGEPSQAGRILLEGAHRVAATDPETAMPMLVEAARNASFGSDGALARDVSAGLRAIEDSPLARGMLTVARVLEDEAVTDHSPIREAEEFLKAGQWDHGLLAASLSLMTGDEVPAFELGTFIAGYCREHGMIGVLPQALALLAQAQMLRGGHAEAARAAAEAMDIAHDIGQPHRGTYIRSVLAWLAGVAGDEEQCLALVSEADQAVEASRVMATWATGLLHLGLGRPQLALESLAPIWHDGRRHQTVALYAAPDLIEAAVRADRPDLAKEPLVRFETYAAAIGRPWATAVAARCAGLMSDGDEAGRCFAEAVRVFDAAPEQQFQHARSELVYGEWLRRVQRRADARHQLSLAFEKFELAGAASWAERARVELEATGAAAVSRAPGLLGRLTSQERQVVRLAAAGMANREIGAQMFLSPRTVGHHLYKAFPKLGVASRGELAELELGDLLSR